MSPKLFIQASLKLGGQERLGRVIGVSRRTVNRWGSVARLSPAQLAALVQAVHRLDPALAQAIADDSHATLEALGVRVPPPPPGPPPPQHAAESVLCAAAEAFDASPRVVRPLLLAAVDRALEMGLTLDALAAGLRPKAAQAKAKG